MDTQIDNNQQQIVEQQTEEQKAIEEKKKNLKTNKKIVLDEEPVFTNIPIIEDDGAVVGSSITMSSDPTIPKASVEPQQELPQEQSGNITF